MKIAKKFLIYKHQWVHFCQFMSRKEPSMRWINEQKFCEANPWELPGSSIVESVTETEAIALIRNVPTNHISFLRESHISKYPDKLKNAIDFATEYPQLFASPLTELEF